MSQSTTALTPGSPPAVFVEMRGESFFPQFKQQSSLGLISVMRAEVSAGQMWAESSSQYGAGRPSHTHPGKFWSHHHRGSLRPDSSSDWESKSRPDTLETSRGWETRNWFLQGGKMQSTEFWESYVDQPGCPQRAVVVQLLEFLSKARLLS